MKAKYLKAIIILLSIIILLLFLSRVIKRYECFSNKSFMTDLLQVFAFSDKKRYGMNGDGGYVIGNINGYDCYISAGVSNEESFTRDFLNYQKLNKADCYAFDGTIEDYPYNYTTNINYFKKNINAYNDDKNTNLHDILSRYNNVFIKMDIEGWEYPWIESLDDTHLKNIKQMVIEYHGINDDSWNHSLDIKKKCFEKLNKTHYIIHAHGNTHSGLTNNIPDVLEITYLNKSLFDAVPKFNNTSLPIPGLDYSNSSHRDYDLSFYPFVQ